MSRVALFAIVFASLAPSISHALASQNGPQSFLQEVCGVQGQKLIIEVVTTQGQQLQTALDAKSDTRPASIGFHMNHCPFCQAGVTDAVLPSVSPAFALYLIQQASQQQYDYQVPAIPTTIQSAHTSRAPPITTL